MFEGNELEKNIINNVADLESEKRKKIILFSILGVLGIAIIIIIIIILVVKKSSSDKDSYGLFECTYFNMMGERTFIFSNKSVDLSPLEININNTIYKGKNVEITQSGYIKVIIKFNSPINMDYLFSGTQLNDIKMISTKKHIITSMVETFSECDRLDYFNISGFDTSRVKNISKLF